MIGRRAVLAGLGTALFFSVAGRPARARSGRPPGRLRIGDPAPELSLQKADGGALRLGALGGQVRVVNFFASYCGPCRQELPELVALVALLNKEREQQGADKARKPLVALLPIGVDADPADSVRFAAALGVPAPVLLDDGALARAAFDPQRLPCTFILDAGGVVRYINRGFGPGYRARVEGWLRTLLR